jgi:hypothetical protein
MKNIVGTNIMKNKVVNITVKKKSGNYYYEEQSGEQKFSPLIHWPIPFTNLSFFSYFFYLSLSPNISKHDARINYITDIR